MGTRQNPGEFDCFAAALPDEPMFVLLARDPLAPGLTRLWAAIRTGDRNMAFAAMVELQNFIPGYRDAAEPEKAREADECSASMRRWRVSNDGNWRPVSPIQPVEPS